VTNLATLTAAEAAFAALCSQSHNLRRGRLKPPSLCIVSSPFVIPSQRILAQESAGSKEDGLPRQSADWVQWHRRESISLVFAAERVRPAAVRRGE
jgi:hypothetical protein